MFTDKLKLLGCKIFGIALEEMYKLAYKTLQNLELNVQFLLCNYIILHD